MVRVASPIGWVNCANSSASNSASGSAGSHQDRALAEMINGLKEESINRGATALMDKEVDSFGVPNPRILIVGCGGSGNNTLSRITHLGVEGAVTVAINTDKQHLIPQSITEASGWPSHHSGPWGWW